MSVNKKYAMMQGFFWMLYGIACSYVSLYLQDKGMDNSSIGLVTAVFGTVSALLQPVLGKLCDKSNRITWKNLLMAMILLFFAICVLMLTVPGKTAGALFIGLLFLGGNLMLALVNGAMAYYKQINETINFGAARGCGSGLYALFALLIGNLAAAYGSAAVPAAGLAVSALLFFAVWQMPCKKGQIQESASRSTAKKGFAGRYPAFIVMTAAFVLEMASHNITGTYLLQIIQSLGGGSRQLGAAMAIQALVELPVLFGFSLLLKKFQPKTLMVFAAAGYLAKAVSYLLVFSIPGVYAAQLTQMVSFAVFASASVYYVLETVPAEDQITGQALMAATMAAGNVLGSFAGGRILDGFSIHAMLLVNAGISAAGLLLALVSGRMSDKCSAIRHNRDRFSDIQ